MARFAKPSEGSWTEHYPELGTGGVSYEDCVSPEFYAAEREKIFRRAWLNVGRVDELPSKGSYFTKTIEVASASIIVVRDQQGQVRAFHNICRHRGNKLVWNENPNDEVAGTCRTFTCKYHAWRYALDGECTFVQQEQEFFGLDKSQYGLAPVHCEVWAGFIFVNFAAEPAESLREFLRPMITELEGYPFERFTDKYVFTADVGCNWKLFLDAFQEYYHVPVLHSQEATPAARPKITGFEAPHYQLDGPHRLVTTSSSPRRTWPEDFQYPIEIVTRSGLFGPWDEPNLGDELGGVNPGRAPQWAADNFQIFPNMELLIWAAGWYLVYRYWPTSPRTHRFEGTLYFPPARTVAQRVAQETAVVMFKEFALQDAGTLVGTQQGLDTGVVDYFPLNDQELLVRHFHRTVGDWVGDHRTAKA
ncbi:aromatic ring-hydroxylating dioxygenase subunit alpha [Nocardia sp. BMG111209]|uniref:aromatic ring-hydroxylating oxygenase subunit alpha n=1 Tax=Nocardia sp. BMG111209 TaxID=1160137 RepID=UPI00037C2D5E|nr:aromatic ring-hydroxylating dioxygenase subunit alpha [Nocardia sp. BMG111209]